MQRLRCLEQELQSELDLPGCQRGRQLTRVRVVICGGHAAKIRMIDQVKGLRAKLNLRPFVQGEVLEQREVDTDEARPGHRVAADVAELARCWIRECGRVEPLLAVAASGRRLGYSPHRVGTGAPPGVRKTGARGGRMSRAP